MLRSPVEGVSGGGAHRQAVVQAPVKCPVSSLCRLERLFEICSKALEGRQTAAVLQQKEASAIVTHKL